MKQDLNAGATQILIMHSAARASGSGSGLFDETTSDCRIQCSPKCFNRAELTVPAASICTM